MTSLPLSNLDDGRAESEIPLRVTLHFPWHESDSEKSALKSS